MSREIKFRAWDKEKGKMFEPTYRAYVGEIEELNILLNGRLGLRRFDDYYDQSMFPERFEIMQYTGLKDKNGVEIYEGDIYHHGEPRITYTVVWVDSGFKGKQNSSTSYAGLESWCDQIEVIGNIYENPELLEREPK